MYTKDEKLQSRKVIAPRGYRPNVTIVVMTPRECLDAPAGVVQEEDYARVLLFFLSLHVFYVMRTLQIIAVYKDSALFRLLSR